MRSAFACRGELYQLFNKYSTNSQLNIQNYINHARAIFVASQKLLIALRQYNNMARFMLKLF
jgi:hypothetical protein